MVCWWFGLPPTDGMIRGDGVVVAVVEAEVVAV